MLAGILALASVLNCIVFLFVKYILPVDSLYYNMIDTAITFLQSLAFSPSTIFFLQFSIKKKRSNRTVPMLFPVVSTKMNALGHACWERTFSFRHKGKSLTWLDRIKDKDLPRHFKEQEQAQHHAYKVVEILGSMLRNRINQPF